MSKFLIVFWYTFLTKLKSKTFIITTSLFLLVVIAGTNFQSIMGLFEGDEQKLEQIAVQDESGELFTPLQEQVVSDQYELIEYSESGEEAKDAVIEGEYAGYLELRLGESGLPEATYFAKNLTSNNYGNSLTGFLQQLKTQYATSQLNVDSQLLQEAFAPVAFETTTLEEGAKTQEELGRAMGIVYVIVLLLYITMIMYGTMIATEVATEKSSRVMEILISSVSPVKQMFGKILGICLLGIVQLLLIAVVAFISIQANGGIEATAVGEFITMDGMETTLVLYGVLFFILGYLLYSTLAAMLGSLVSKTEEVNQIITPLMLLIIAAFMLTMTGFANPEAKYIEICSFIPFFTPLLMLLRIGMVSPPMWQILISIVLLIASIVALGYFGARIYRGGVLMYNRTSLFKDIRQAITLSKKERNTSN
ncbi:hypothetical protein N781_14785 [Pontibacillus halophilus JSM 076056 = DSM 19796]|uniref:ABC-2 type transporter transmembrane domain-containing protein n=1 Tax=Pontibacillus halophilus JSM 076056 = DSM 19796 TaxID=1385510 RepID=A0A0A5GKU7_9BACI|nr:ABC transporter permease [Pontibacillus halophilus]KGX92594.1 hypothetical protein N781_14785 [Pontibacillus halophilus JSM 076056 = DSM 19796]